MNPRYLKWISAFATLIKLSVAIFAGYLSYRVAKITGHWEYGMLTFMTVGYLSYLTDIRREVQQKGLYN